MWSIASESAALGFLGRFATKRRSAFSALTSRLSAVGSEAVIEATSSVVAAFVLGDSAHLSNANLCVASPDLSSASIALADSSPESATSRHSGMSFATLSAKASSRLMVLPLTLRPVISSTMRALMSSERMPATVGSVARICSTWMPRAFVAAARSVTVSALVKKFAVWSRTRACSSEMSAMTLQGSLE